MPCTDGGPPSEYEIQNIRLRNLVVEVFSEPARPVRPGDNDTMARRLCDWCQTHDVKKMSLELQIWWRDHQRADARREADAKAKSARAELRKQALGKLTAKERAALGVE